MSNSNTINDVIDTENWIMKISRMEQYNSFMSSISGYDDDPTAFAITEFAKRERDIPTDDESTVALFSQWITVGPAGEQGAYENIEAAQAAGFPSTQLFWFYKP